MYRYFEKFCYLLVVATGLLIFSRCANTQTGPSGGPKDTIPPVLLRTMPGEYSVNFHAKRVVLLFDENMAVKEPQKNVVLSPPALQRPTVRRSGHSIIVIFEDTLQKNRTYTIDFGSALVDNNENNPFRSYTYVFSTGAAIDSMAFVGMVRDAYTLNPLQGATVMLYENLSDTAIYKTLPVSVARTDAWGLFTMRNIAPRTYRMIAIEDKNSNYLYEPGSESVAFLDTLVAPELTVSMLPVAPDITDTVALLARPYERTLLAAKENVRKQYLSEYIQLGKRQIRLTFNQYYPVIDSFAIGGIDSADYVIEHSRFNDTLTYWITTPTLPDTLRGAIKYLKTDSLDQLTLTEAKLKFSFKEPEKKEEKKKDKKDDEPEEVPKLQPRVGYDPQTVMEAGISIGFTDLPVKIDTTKLFLFKVNSEKNTRTKEPFRWVRDTASLRRFAVQAKWTSVTDYELEVLPDAFTDIYGLRNDSIVQKITTPNPDKYCHIALNLSNVSSQFIVQVLDTKKERVIRTETTAKAGKITFAYLSAGSYCIRFINDKNRNGVWDPGNIKEKIQPEPVAFLSISSDGSDIITLKENFDITQDVDMEKLFTPEPAKTSMFNREHEHDHEHDHEHEHDHDEKQAPEKPAPPATQEERIE